MAEKSAAMTALGAIGEKDSAKRRNGSSGSTGSAGSAGKLNLVGVKSGWCEAWLAVVAACTDGDKGGVESNGFLSTCVCGLGVSCDSAAADAGHNLIIIP